ncbi:ectoine/hydroxyectoine ABC transporter substrate-binding protein EhuB [Bradyrhizobium diazoefficiens]|uniref:ectoine/hydroxyectoine ABC transporter substrate-binding protein EhuB n=1 Tax=Bradyrhizobium diazoefficiens TaxID=1355477 RepID=UPI00190B2FB5|nr:ectoine/hydroxyectoine ABC transporter substrate-binding protein EhuB [Bradyrhizobium diazoefficiens]MBK3662785.1 ectoine/hydroxyectoine ABC transporter substrate-binding protein EhuB [Bradyrhizobium diazoefficiens]
MLIGSAALAVSGAGASAVSAQSITDRVLKEGKITIGIFNGEPWGFVGQDGKVTGFHPELIAAVLGPLGVANIDFAIVDWPALIPSLLSKRIDVIACGMAITPVRCEQVIFSNPDLAIGDAALVKTGNPHNIHSYADVARNPALRMGTARASIEVDNAIKSGIPKDRMLLFPDGDSLVSALLAGRIDVLMNPTPAVIPTLKDPNLKGKLERAIPFTGLVENGREQAFYTAVEFRPEDARLRDLYNESLAKRRAEGTVTTIAARYGLTASDIAPDSLTAKDLCPNNYR